MSSQSLSFRAARPYGVAALLLAGALVPSLWIVQPVEAQQQVQLGDTVITTDQLDYDMEKQQYVFTGDVDLVSKNSHMTSDKMTVQLNADNAMVWTKCVGKVFIEKKDPMDGTAMTGRGQTMDYYEIEQKANLQGNVVVHQGSTRLTRPAVITGSRVDMDLKTKVNVVHRSEDAQAKVNVLPKGEEGKPEPEPADLIGDRIDMNSVTQEYVAQGKPQFLRPSQKLVAKTIRFQVDEKTNEVNTAYADDDVVYDAKSDKGSIIHATGDKGVFQRAENQITLTGHVHSTIKEPDAEKPSVYQGHEFVYNTVTGRRSLKSGPTGRAIVMIPEKPKPATPVGANAEKKPATGTEPKP